MSTIWEFAGTNAIIPCWDSSIAPWSVPLLISVGDDVRQDIWLGIGWRPCRCLLFGWVSLKISGAISTVILKLKKAWHLRFSLSRPKAMPVVAPTGGHQRGGLPDTTFQRFRLEI